MNIIIKNPHILLKCWSFITFSTLSAYTEHLSCDSSTGIFLRIISAFPAVHIYQPNL